LVAWHLGAYPRGVVAANFDRLLGHDEVMWYGELLPWDHDYTRLLDERYGIRGNKVAECVVGEELARYVRGYNSVAEPRLREKHGKDVLAECAADAQREWGRKAGLAVGPLAAALAPVDRAVIGAALRHFSARDDAPPVTREAGGHQVLLHLKSSGPVGELQIRGSDGGPDRPLPPDACDDLHRRNAEQVSLAGGSFGEGVVVTDVEPFRPFLSETDYRERFPRAKGWAEASLPGYSGDGARAVLVFWFGPTAHGAKATYLLVNRGFGWEVEAFDLAYYV
jgi:hypothetical protein